MSGGLFNPCPTCKGSGLVDASLPVGDARTRARRSATDTARSAAAAVTPGTARKVHIEVLTMLADHEEGLADFEIAELSKRNPSTLRARRSELMHADMVADSGRRCPIPDTARLAIVWELTSMGRLALDLANIEVTK